ncbi:hypothetical protein [Pseudoalteromonas rhizosphaerae]|uniref:hypothetical protein n=1 Tax=Pseudoalteromonas rhizosphaerae TaxID=2518973 RepID=UPI0037041343
MKVRGYTQQQLSFIAEKCKTMTAKQVCCAFNIEFEVQRNFRQIDGVIRKCGFERAQQYIAYTVDMVNFINERKHLTSAVIAEQFHSIFKVKLSESQVRSLRWRNNPRTVASEQPRPQVLPMFSSESVIKSSQFRR